jgi:putative Holliday junction resolvase
VGVAVSDPAGRVATPVRVMDAAVLRDSSKIASLVDEFDAELVVIGLPVSLDGTEGPQARRVRAIGERLAQGLRVEVRYADERMSSKEARRVLTEAGVSEREQRGRVDTLAATMFLQSFLDAHAPTD